MSAKKVVGWIQLVLGVILLISVLIIFYGPITNLPEYYSPNPLPQTENITLETQLMYRLGGANFLMTIASLWIISMILAGLFGILFILEGIVKIKEKPEIKI